MESNWGKLKEYVKTMLEQEKQNSSSECYKKVLRKIEELEGTMKQVTKLEEDVLFDYNFRVCHICDSNTIYQSFNTERTCPNGCTYYDIDPQGGTVSVDLFGAEENGVHEESEEVFFCIPLYKRSHNSERLQNRLKQYLKVVAYWRENERYKEKLQMMKRDK